MTERTERHLARMAEAEAADAAWAEREAAGDLTVDELRARLFPKPQETNR